MYTPVYFSLRMKVGWENSADLLEWSSGVDGNMEVFGEFPNNQPTMKGLHFVSSGLGLGGQALCTVPDDSVSKVSN